MLEEKFGVAGVFAQRLVTGILFVLAIYLAFYRSAGIDLMTAKYESFNFIATSLVCVIAVFLRFFRLLNNSTFCHLLGWDALLYCSPGIAGMSSSFWFVSDVPSFVAITSVVGYMLLIVILFSMASHPHKN